MIEIIRPGKTAGMRQYETPCRNSQCDALFRFQGRDAREVMEHSDGKVKTRLMVKCPCCGTANYVEHQPNGVEQDALPQRT